MEKLRFDMLERNPKDNRYNFYDVLDILHSSKDDVTRTINLSNRIKYLLTETSDAQTKNTLVKIFNKYVNVKIYGQTITKGHNFLSFKLEYNLPEKIESAINKKYMIVKNQKEQQAYSEMEKEINALEKDLIG